MSEQSTDLTAQERGEPAENSDESGIHEKMNTLEIAKNMFKGTWILGKRAVGVAKEAAERLKDKVENVQNLKEYYQALSDDELIRKARIGDSSDDNLAILSVLKDRGYDGESIKSAKETMG